MGRPQVWRSSGLRKVRDKRCQNEPWGTSAQEQSNCVAKIEPPERKGPGLAEELPAKPFQSLLFLEL